MADTNRKIPDIICDQYEELCGDLQNTYLKWMMNRQLFGSGSELLDFLDDRAPSFFVAVRDSFAADLVVSVSRFTDQTKGTLTLGAIIKQLDKSSHSDLASDLKTRQARIITASARVKLWRDNLVAHKSLAALEASSKLPLPDLTWKDVDAILEELAGALNAVQIYFLNAETGYADLIAHGDAKEVVRLMRLGVAHEAAEIQRVLQDPA